MREHEDWIDAHGVVCDNVEMALDFISKIRNGSTEVRPRWCLIIAANALWSAVDVFNRSVAKSVDERLNSKRSKPTNTTNWFKECEPLIASLRSGSAHTGKGQGVGLTVGPGPDDVAQFFWARNAGGDYDQIPLDEALSKLERIAEQIKAHVFEKTHEWSIAFG